jgi:hypothetical protein
VIIGYSALSEIMLASADLLYGIYDGEFRADIF